MFKKVIEKVRFEGTETASNTQKWQRGGDTVPTGVNYDNYYFVLIIIINNISLFI